MPKKKVNGVKKWADFLMLLDVSEKGDVLEIEAEYNKVTIKLTKKSKLPNAWKRKPQS